MHTLIVRMIGLLLSCCAAAGFAFASPSSIEADAISGAVAVLPFRIADAEFSTALNAIVAVRAAPAQLVIYEPETHASFTVNLPAVPTCVGVSPDGLRAAVGYDGWISEIDLVARTVVQTRAVVGLRASDVIHGGNGYAYVSEQMESLRTISLSTGAVTGSYGYSYPARIRLYPTLDRIYAADRGIMPDDVLRYDFDRGVAEYSSETPYHGAFSFCGDVWSSANGARLFTACGNTLRTSNDPALDMSYGGRLSEYKRVQWLSDSAEAGTVAVIPGYFMSAPEPRRDHEIHYYAQESLLYRGSAVLPDFTAENKRAPSRGRWVFFNAAGTKQYIVVQADESSGISSDFGVVTIDCTGSRVWVTPSTVDAPPDGGQVSLSVAGSAGCVWNALSDVPWLQTTSTGAGNGTLLVNVRANGTASRRHGTIIIGRVVVPFSQEPSRGTTPPVQAVSRLPFRVIDAEFSTSLGAIVAVSDYALHVFDTATRSVTTTSLESLATAVSVSPDGLFAAVGHSGAISYVDLMQVAVVKRLDVSADVEDLILAGNGYVYAIPRGFNADEVRSIEIETNGETLQHRLTEEAGKVARLHPAGAWIYTADRNRSPGNLVKFDISGGTATGLYDSPYHGDYPMCENLWLSENGTRIYTACGHVFRASPEPTLDLRWIGTIADEPAIRSASQSEEFGSVAVLPGYDAETGTPTPRRDHEVHYYSPESLAYEGQMLLPQFEVESGVWPSRGRWHFFSADGQRQHVVVESDPGAGLQTDFGVVTVDCFIADVTLTSSSAAMPGTGGTVHVPVSGKPGCRWKVATSTPWLTTASEGVSEGVVSITALANPAVTSRTGTVSIGSRTFTIVQAGSAIEAFQATAASPTSVALTWTFALTPHHYEVWRNSGAGFSLIGAPVSGSFTDPAAPSNSSLVYRVRAVMNDSTASTFAADHAHTFLLTDPSLQMLPLRAVHLEELRTIVTGLSIRAGLPPPGFTDLDLRGVVARQIHILQLRDAVNAIRSALGSAPLQFPLLVPFSPITATTTEELRSAVE